MNIKRIFIICFITWLLTGCFDEEGTPVANAGPDKVVLFGENQTITLNGEASFDPNGDLLTHHWSLEAIPSGSTAELSKYIGPEVSLELDKIGTYRVGLIVDDGVSRSSKDIITIVYISDTNNSGESDNGKLFSHNDIPTTSCVDCHTQPVDHLPTSNFCHSCHSVESWVLPTGTVNHNEVVGSCIGCHNNVVAVGKLTNHISTSDACDACHTVTSWIPAIIVDHNEVIGTCDTCHNGILATGKSANHTASSDACGACHSTFMWMSNEFFGGVLFNHTGINDGCSECHDGVQTSGLSINHINSSQECELCHSTNAWVPATTVDHSQTNGVCETCHNGVIASGKSPTHITTSDVCDACHSTTIFIPTVAIDHNETIGDCISCHTGIIARGKHAAHLTTTDVCETCHSTTTFIPTIIVDHSQVLGTCASCHSPTTSHTSVGVEQSCESCHNTSNWHNPTQPLPTPATGG